MANINRREFIKANAAGAFGLALSSAGISIANPPADVRPIRVGVVGLGRGGGLLRVMLKIKGVQIPALCDINTEKLAQSQATLVQAGRPRARGYYENESSWQKLMDRDDLDAVIIATPWELHTPMAVYAMKRGKYAGVEVPAAYTL